MTFKVTKRAKRSARNNRIRKEKKWKPANIIKWFLFTLSLFSLIQAIRTEEESYFIYVISIFIFSGFFVIAICVHAVLINLCSAWIQERINEHMWIKGKILHHFWQYAFAAGLNIRNTDSRGIEYQLDLETVRELKYDPKSKRIEFKVSGHQIFYNDFINKQVDEMSEVTNTMYTHVCYDYYQPSLVEVLKKQGIPCKEETLEFKIRQI